MVRAFETQGFTLGCVPPAPWAENVGNEGRAEVSSRNLGYTAYAVTVRSVETQSFTLGHWTAGTTERRPSRVCPGLKGRRNAAQGETLGPGHPTAASPGLKGRRNAAQGETLGLGHPTAASLGLKGRWNAAQGETLGHPTPVCPGLKGRRKPAHGETPGLRDAGIVPYVLPAGFSRLPRDSSSTK